MRSFTIYVLNAKENGTGSFKNLAYYYSGYSISPESIHWNTGTGYRDDNVYPLTPGSTKLGRYYAGSGRPMDEETQPPIEGSKAITALAGGVGYVSGGNSYYSQYSNVGTVAAYSSFTQYSRRVIPNDYDMGSVHGDGNIDGGYYYSRPLGTQGMPTGVKGIPTGYDSGASFWTAVPKTNYAFVRWEVNGSEVTAKSSSSPVYVTKSNDSIDIYDRLRIDPTSALEYEAEAVFAAKFNVRIYSNNERYPGVAYINGYTGDKRDFSVVDGVSQNIPLASQMMSPPSGYVFGGWNTAADGTGIDLDDGGDLSELYDDTPGETIRIYAQWRRPNVKITRANVAGSSAPSVANVGTLSLYSAADNYAAPLSVTAADGSIYYEAAQGASLRVRCSLSDADFGWRALGVQTGVDSDEQPVYAAVYDFTKGASDVDIDYYFQAKALRTVSLKSEVDGGGTLPSGCSVEIISPSAADSDGKYYEGRTITIKINKAAGWKPTRARFINADSGVAQTAERELAANDTEFTFDVTDYNMQVVVYFVRTEFTVGVGKHSTSQSAITSVSVTRNSSSVTSAEYNDEVTFTAVVATGYEFEAWYTKPNGGERKSTANPYAYTVAGDLTLYARAKVTVGFAIGYPDGTEAADKTCSFKIGDTTVIPAGSVGPTTRQIALGASINYALTAGPGWGFNGWFNANAVVPLAKSGRFTQPADTPGGTYTAKFAEDATKTLAVYVVLYTGTDSNIFQSRDDATKLLTFLPTNAFSSTDPDPGDDTHVVMKVANEVQEVSITAEPSVSYNNTTYHFYAFAKSFADVATALPADEDKLPSTDGCYKFLLNEDRVPAEDEEDEDKAIYVFYGTPSYVTVSLGLTSTSDKNSGKVEVVAVQRASGDTTSVPTIAPDRQSATAWQGSTLVVRAIAMNGYKFVGWYWNNPSGNDTASATATNAEVKMPIGGTLYAKFVEDTHYLCEWEGSRRNKVMEWCSKTYSAPQPFNPSACRVDATDYRPDANLTLSVEMFSSPDAEPTAIATLPNPSGEGAITSQDARRLPIRRRERFMRVCVKSAAEVDGIFVATSMGGLAT